MKATVFLLLCGLAYVSGESCHLTSDCTLSCTDGTLACYHGLCSCIKSSGASCVTADSCEACEHGRAHCWGGVCHCFGH
uniref:Serine protease inhibitor Cvsi-2-like n=1 Tax=Crassostrea virginica TaxID=6565 RepID=A0A8B8C1E8_CRAVI|nr:serine protease inhibitor Cvsi-2-like [Crassostrea virginica]